MSRPRVDPTDRSVLVTVTLPARQFDEYARKALERDVSVPQVIREALDRRPEPKKS